MERRSRSFVVAATVVTYVPATIVGCGVPRTSTVTASHLDGEEIYRAVFFLSDDLGESIQDMMGTQTASLTEDELAVLTEAQDLLVDAIDVVDPGFFQSFESQMESGDPVIVEAAIRQGAEITMEAALSSRDEIAAAMADLGGAQREAFIEAMNQASAKISEESGIELPPLGDAELDDIITLWDNPRLDAKITEFGASGYGQSRIFAGIVAGLIVLIVHDLAVAVNVAVAVNFWMWAYLEREVETPSSDGGERGGDPLRGRYVVASLTKLLAPTGS